MNQSAQKFWREGGCHCGKVRFKVRSTFESALLCNCSICQRTGFVHLIVEKEDFQLLSGEQNLENYQFGSQIAKHLFCRSCGVKSYYVPRSHPDSYSVNLRCVENLDLGSINIIPFDGQNWNANIDKIRPV